MGEIDRRDQNVRASKSWIRPIPIILHLVLWAMSRNCVEKLCSLLRMQGMHVFKFLQREFELQLFLHRDSAEFDIVSELSQ